MGANTVKSYVVAQSCNVYLISSPSGTDREEILVNIQIWLGSYPTSACCGRPPDRDKRHAVLQCMLVCACVCGGEWRGRLRGARVRRLVCVCVCACVRVCVCVCEVAMFLRTHVAHSLLKLTGADSHSSFNSCWRDMA